MKALETIQKTREYLDYLEEHIKNVEKAWEVFQEKCTKEFLTDDFHWACLNNAIINHDLSKLDKEEFTDYRKQFYPVEGEEGFEATGAWIHHIAKNNHHWQNWTLYEGEEPNYKYLCLIHMIVDWMAMGYKFNDTPREYYEKNKNNIYLPDHHVKIMYEMFDLLEG